MGRLRWSIAAAFVAALVVSAAAGQEVDPLTQVRPGKTKAADIEAVFGAPAQREGKTRAGWEPNKGGVRELLAWFGDDGACKWARIALTNELPPAAVALLFDLTGEPIVTRGNAFSDADAAASLTQHYAGGVHLVVAGGKVSHVWLTGADERPADVAKAATLLSAPAAQPAAAEGTATASAAGAPLATDAGGIDRRDFADPGAGTVLVPYTPGGTVVGPDGGAVSPSTPAVPGAQEGPAAGQPAPAPGPGALPRFLNVHYVSYGPPMDPAKVGVDVFARVNAVGVKDRTVTMTLTLRAPGGAAAQSGSIPSLSDKVAYDVSTWERASISVPPQVLAPGQPVAVLHWQAECDGLTSYAEADCTLTAFAGPGGAGEPAAVRAITLTNVRVEHGAELGGFPGMWAYADIGAVGLAGKALTGEVRFRVAGGAAVRPPANVQGASGADGAAALTAQDAAASDNTSWTPFRIFVPYVAFGLPSGTHRVIMTYKASCEGLAAASEQEIDISAP